MNSRRILYIIVGVLAVAARAALAGVVDGPITNPANGNRYYLLAPNAWTDSESEAVTLGGTLATVDSAADNAWILNTFGAIANPSGGNAPSNANLWIGFYDPDLNDGTGAQHAADFIWASGARITYTNWEPGEPNNDAGWGGEYYAEINTVAYNIGSLPGEWNDQNNTSSGSLDFGVVQVVPEPSCGGVFGFALLLLRRRHR